MTSNNENQVHGDDAEGHLKTAPTNIHPDATADYKAGPADYKAGSEDDAVGHMKSAPGVHPN